MTDADVLAALDDRQTLALTAWAEARQAPRTTLDDHSPVEELIAVMVVVRNRRATPARWRATDASYKAICLAPKQFSCWTPNSGSNHDALMAWAATFSSVAGFVAADHPLLAECLYLADGVIAGTLLDRTNGATSYWAPAAMVPAGRQPAWAYGLPRWKIGDQFFVRTV